MAREIDNKCDYRQFKHRNEGKVPCLSLGNSYFDDYLHSKGEITGICFQKVDDGKVKPIIDADELLKVDWRCAPRRPAVQHQFLELDYHLVPSEKWQIFANVLANLRAALLVQVFQEQMTPHNDVAPTTLYDGFHSNVWRGGGNDDKRSSAHLQSRMADVLPVVRQAGEMNRLNMLDLQTILHCMLEGFKIMGEPMLRIFIDNILGITVFGETETVIPPANPSYNNSIENGVLHCLVYGYHEDQMRIEERQHRNGRERGRIHQKLLLPKVSGARSRSRSRSPSPAENNILAEIESIPNPDPDRVINMAHLVQNPNNFIVKPSCLHNYFEPHKPDLVFLSYANGGILAKIVVEISSFNKYGSYVDFLTHLRRSTEQCFEQCMAGLSSNQEKIAGLVVVPDGMKLILIDKFENEDNSFYFKVQETDLVNWSEKNKFFSVMLKLVDYS